MKRGGRQVFSNTTGCPVCGCRCHTIRNAQVTPNYREVVYRCSNAACDHVFTATIVPGHTIRESLLTPPQNSEQS